MRPLFKSLVTVFAIVFMLTFAAKAQLLGIKDSAKPQVQAQPQTKAQTQTQAKPQTQTSSGANATTESFDVNEFLNEATGGNAPAGSDEGKYLIMEPDVAQIDRPTLDGVQRGNTSIVPVSADEGVKVNDDELILLYYRDFEVRRVMGKQVSCRVSFVVTTTLSRKLTNLSTRLVWPGMDTSVSFDDVEPNQETAFTYVLLGDGCFNMDKKPNIIVNRCRVKGLTQQQCASKIRWLTKKN